MLIINYIWEYLINFFEVILFYVFVNQKLYIRLDIPNIKLKQYTYLLFRFFAVCLMNHYGINSIYTLTFSCIIEVIFTCIFYNSRFIYKAFIGMLFTVLCMIAEIIPFFTLTVFSDIPSIDLLESGILRIPSTALYLTLLAVFVFLFRFLASQEVSASPHQRILFSIISLLGVSFGHYILLTLVIFDKYEIEYLSARLAFITLLYMFLFITLLFFIYQLSLSYSSKQKLSELQALRSLEEQEYHNNIERVVALREMKHDMLNHLNSLELMAAKLSSSEMLHYISGLRTTVEDSRVFLSTGNMAVDCILTSKISAAKEATIDTKYSVLLPENFNMDAVAVCSLLGNLWDNAIEACSKILQDNPAENPFINFYMKPYQDMTMIHIENNFTGKCLYTSDGHIQTTKDSKEHGIGLKRIESIVKNAQGILNIDIKDQIFVVHILIPQVGENA